MSLDGWVLVGISSLANVQIRGMFSICGFSIYKFSIFRLSNYRVLPLLNLETKLSRCFEFLTLAWGVSKYIMSSSMRTKPWLVSRLMAPTLDVKLRNSTPPTLLPFFSEPPGCFVNAICFQPLLLEVMTFGTIQDEFFAR